jgi:aminopeptidase N
MLPLWMPLSILAALLIGAAPAPADSIDAFMGPGVSRELAQHRAAQLRAVAYELSLDLLSRDSARGVVTVHFERVRPGDVILDFRGPAMGEVVVNGRSLERPVWNGAHLRVPDAALRNGANEVRLQFTAAIAPAGASIIRFTDGTDGEDYLYTLLVPADANQLFPCFDQPDLKARLTLSLTLPPHWAALSNAPLAQRDSTATRVIHRFAPTEPISTYLMAFAAGPWVTVSSQPQGELGPVKLYVRASRAQEVESDSLIAINVRALRWLEEYFGTAYPFGKLDMLLAPAFPFGGMEHPGAIFYNEDRLIFRERPTLNQLISRKSLIYHEVAHQWFGDLVTMEWFDDLWLKEGFATYMAARMQSALDPGTDAWKTFHLRNKPLAYSVDATAGTTPVWQRLGNLDQAKSAYGPIVYNKAPSVLKQLEYVVGEQAFRDGVQLFIRRHAFANATWQDLLAAIGEAANRSLDEWGARYILQPGVPVLEQELTIDDGRIQRLVLVQRPARELVPGARWPIRVRVVLWYPGAKPVEIPVDMNDTRLEVRDAAGLRAPAFVFANAGDYAYALVLPDAHSVSWLETGIGSIPDSFLRAMLWGAMWDLVREAQLAPARFIAMALTHLPAESDEQVAGAVLSRLTRATRAYLSPVQREARIGGVEAALLAGMADSARSYGIRKAHLDALVAVAQTSETMSTLDALLDSTHAAGEPLRGPTRWSIITALVARDAPGAQHRLAHEAATDTTPDGRRRAFAAGAARPDSAVKREYFTRYLHDASLNEDWATASLDAFNAPGHQHLTAMYLRPALDTLPWIQRNRRIFFLGAWLSAFIGSRDDTESLAIVRHFLHETGGHAEDLRLKVLQATDELERTVAIRRAFDGASAGNP